METDQRRFEFLLKAGYPCVTIQTFEEEDALSVVVSAAMESGRDSLVWSNSMGVRDGLIVDANRVADTEHPAAAFYHLAANSRGRRVIILLDAAPHLVREERTLRQFRDLLQCCQRDGSTLVLIDHQSERPAVIRGHAIEFELSLPDEEELESIFKETLRKGESGAPASIQINRHDLQTVIRNLRGLSRRQARQIIRDSICDDGRFDLHDVNRVLAHKRRALQAEGLLEFVESPVTMEEIGGLARLKDWLGRRQESFRREAAQFGLPLPRGVLMLGVQGGGKSLAAKAVATAWRMPLMRLDVGALYDRFIGESERRLRDTLRQAEMMSPIVLWIDEIEKAFASAASRSVDGGLSQRMFGALLTWMQERAGGVFVAATANDIEALPPELLRKGRFDEIFFVDLPGLDARAQIFSIHLARRGRDPRRFDLAMLAEAADGFSGAEIEQAVIGGLHLAFAARTELTAGHLIEAIRSSPPLSTTMRERMAALRAWSQGRCVAAD